jgi:virginiamycin B lyase
MKLQIWLVLAASLTACAGPGTSGLPPKPLGGSDSAVREPATRAVLRVVIPRRRHAHFISPATRSIAITIAGSHGTAHHNFDLTPATNPKCKANVCTLTFGIAPGRYTYSLATYDGLLGTGGDPTGHVLSARQNVPATVVKGRSNAIGVTLDGVPKAVVLSPASGSAIHGALPSYALSKCYFHTPGIEVQQMSVLATDADGNYIIGAGAPSPSLVSDDAVHLKVEPPSKSSPNTFALEDPTGSPPVPNSIVHLTATETPAAASGGVAVTTHAAVTFDAAICGIFTTMTLPETGSQPVGITVGSDAAMWFAENGSDKIGRITTGGVITEFATSGGPTSVAAGPQNTIWFTQCASNQIGEIATTGGTVYEYHIPTAASAASNIAADPHGGFPWFTERAGNNIGYFRPSGLGSFIVHETAVPTAASEPQGIAAGSDGALWFVEESGNSVGRISGSTVTEYPIPTSDSQPAQIAPGPDGALWFTESGAHRIGRVSTSGSITEYALPAPYSSLAGIAAGPDGAMWFAETGSQKIGRITMTGAISEFSLATAGNPYGIVLGPDDAMWFTAPFANAIVRLQ